MADDQDGGDGQAGEAARFRRGEASLKIGAGSTLDSFREAEGVLAELQAQAVGEVIASRLTAPARREPSNDRRHAARSG